LAPEVFKSKENSEVEYFGDKVDLFACGVILYNMVSGKKPFNDAKESDIRYQAIIKQDFESFWSYSGPEFTERFKTVI
jgi:serine/threonine protein kinase